MNKHVRIGDRRVKLPRSRVLRIAVGVVLILGGILGFLPILGFWMIPLGLLILSVDIPLVRRWRRQGEVRLMRWWRTSGVRRAWRRLVGRRGHDESAASDV
ncbi:MAG: hypothetical protein V3V97_05100 [Hyphomicrobiaceae bacterium]